MQSTYTISQFISFCEVLPSEVIQITSHDNWFELNSTNDVKRFIKFLISGTHISFVDRSNFPKEGYVEIDKTFNIKNINVDTVLNINQLASIVFSVNGNKNQFILLRNFVNKLKQNEKENYEECIRSRRMKIFCSHLAYIRSNMAKDSLQIPEWLMTDPLFDEEIKAWEKMHPGCKFSIESLPPFERGAGIFLSPFYLCFIMTIDKFSICEIEKTQKILNGIKLDLEKFNSIICLN
jgi:hypothetical protein